MCCIDRLNPPATVAGVATDATGPKPTFPLLQSGQRDMHATASAGDLRQALCQQPKQRRCLRSTDYSDSAMSQDPDEFLQVAQNEEFVAALASVFTGEREFKAANQSGSYSAGTLGCESVAVASAFT